MERVDKQKVLSVAAATQQESPFPPQWVFVVQFHTETSIPEGHLDGRVEHVVSGQATHFHSLEELLEFMGRVLTTVSVQPPPKS